MEIEPFEFAIRVIRAYPWWDWLLQSHNRRLIAVDKFTIDRE